MQISLRPLRKDDLPLLLAWLSKPHLKTWWDPEIVWTADLVAEKYGSYIEGYKLEGGIKKPMQAYIAHVDDVSVAYVQLYNAHDFPREDGASLDDLPRSLAALDIFIGEQAYMGRGYGSAILKQFLQEYVANNYDACFVDPDKTNLQVIRAYEKTGFESIGTRRESLWMLWRRNELND
jgi:RimJ/RimL family protein N-acetyltransferase